MTPNICYIKKLLKERGWNQSEFARQMGVSRSEVNRFLRGECSGGKKLFGGLKKAFPDETIERLFIFPCVSPIDNNIDNIAFNRNHTELLLIKNLSGSLVAKLDPINGLIEITKRGHVTQFKVQEGAEIKVTHYPPQK